MTMKLIWHRCVHFVQHLLLVNPAFRISIGIFGIVVIFALYMHLSFFV